MSGRQFVLAPPAGVFADWAPTFGPEEWRPAPGFEGRYEVSSLGHVRSLRNRGPGSPLRKKPAPVKVGRLSDSGYPVVVLSDDLGRRRGMALHRLVLRAFAGPCPAGMEACHRDANRLECAAWNLYWGTRSRNASDRVRHGHMPPKDARGRWLPAGALIEDPAASELLA